MDRKHLRAATYPVLATLAAGIIGCVQDPAPFDPRSVQQPARVAAEGTPQHTMRPLPTTLSSPFLPTTVPSPGSSPPPATYPTGVTGPSVRLSLQEIVQRAVANNLDVRVAGYEAAVDQTRIVEAQAHFDPTFFTNVQAQVNNNQTAGTAIPDPNGTGRTIVFDANKQTQYSVTTGIRQNLESGGQVEFRYQAAQNDLDPRQFQLNPYYEDNLVLQITQPLLREFGADVNRARITIARDTQKVTLLDFRKALEDNVQDIEKNYWELVQAVREVKIQEELLQRTIDTADILFRRRGQDVTRVQISQANASVEARRAQLIRARAHVADISDQLKQLMNDPEMPVTSQTLILPADAPVEDPIHFDLEDQVNTAMENRLELAQQQAKIDSADVTERVAKNNLLPQLNAVIQTGPQGLNRTPGEALQDQMKFDHFSYTLGLQFEVPLGNREARAIYQRTLLQRQQAIDSYRSIIDKVSLDVKTALREVHTTWDEMIANRQSRFAAADSLAALQQRQDAQQPLTPEFVQLKLDAQERLAEAERSETTAIYNYNIAISRLERSKGTILQYNNVVMAEQQIPITARGAGGNH